MKMGFFKRSKKEIPAELPDLALDKPLIEDISNKNAETFQNQIEFPKSPVQQMPVSQQEVKSIQNAISKQNQEEEKGFFKELASKLTDQTKDIEKIESFYNTKFKQEDIVNQMRSYWEEKEPSMIPNSHSNNLKERIIEKSNALHALEKEWQNMHFALLSKEEQIRADEKELKEIIAEFIEVSKKTGKKGKKR